MMAHVWLAEYCPCQYESGFEAVVLCRTRKIARAALKIHKDKKLTHSWGKEKKLPWQHWRVRRAVILQSLSTDSIANNKENKT